MGALADDPDADLAAGADLLRRAGDVAQRHQLVLAVSNAAGTACASGLSLAKLLDAVGHPHVRAAWNPVAALRGGGLAADALEADALTADALAADALTADVGALAGHVAFVTVRDGRGGAEAWSESAPGEGAVGWSTHLAALRACGFDGPLCLEVHGEPTGPFGLQATTSLVQLVRAQRRSERNA
ncbi:MAG: TIM barrel protein [Bacteroidota bacterium]